MHRLCWTSPGPYPSVVTEAPSSATAPPPRPRPAPVTVAFALQLALTGTLLVTIGIAVAEAFHYDALIRQAALTAEADASDAAFERSTNVVGASAIAVPATLLAVWLGTAAAWLRRGSNVARILTLVGLGAPVLLGLLACLFGGVLAVMMVPFLAGLPDEPLPDEPMPEGDGSASYQRLERLDGGGWSIAFDVAGMTTTSATFLLGISTGVLLLTGASNRYFGAEQSMPGGYPPPYPVPAYRYPTPYPYPPAPGMQQPSFWYAPAPFDPSGSGQATTRASDPPPPPPG